MLVGVVEVRGDVEDDLLDRAGECEWRLVGVASVDDLAVVAAHVEARVAAEPERHRVVDSAASDWLSVDEQRDLTGRGGLRLVGGEGQLDVDISDRQLR